MKGNVSNYLEFGVIKTKTIDSLTLSVRILAIILQKHSYFFY